MDKVGFSPLRFAHSKETVQQLSTAAGRLWRAVTRPPTVGVREARAAVSGRRCCAPCERQRVSLGRTRVCLTATPRRAEGGGTGAMSSFLWPSGCSRQCRQPCPGYQAPTPPRTVVSEGEREAGPEGGAQVAAPATLPSRGALWRGREPQRWGEGFLTLLSSWRKKLFISQEIPPWPAKEDGLSAQ